MLVCSSRLVACSLRRSGAGDAVVATSILDLHRDATVLESPCWE